MDTELHSAAEKLLEAAHAYYKIMQKKDLAGGCIWLTDKDGAMVVFTRGEFKNQLLHNIETRLPFEQTYSFGTAERV